MILSAGDVMADIFRFVYSKVCCCGCCRRKDKNKVESLKPDGVRMFIMPTKKDTTSKIRHRSKQTLMNKLFLEHGPRI